MIIDMLSFFSLPKGDRTSVSPRMAAMERTKYSAPRKQFMPRMTRLYGVARLPRASSALRLSRTRADMHA